MKERISVQSFVEEAMSRKIKNDRITPNAVEDYIREKLDIVDYLPFKTKRTVIETVVEQIVREEDGIKKVDSVSQFLSFVVSMLMSHTTLKFGENPEEDYDALSKHGLLEPIIAMFAKDYSECDALLKASIADELADNNLNVIISKFLNGILSKFDGVGDMLKGFTENLDLSKLVGANMNEEEIAKILGLVDKLNK